MGRQSKRAHDALVANGMPARRDKIVDPLCNYHGTRSPLGSRAYSGESRDWNALRLMKHTVGDGSSHAV
jgi:hypothetical protein